LSLRWSAINGIDGEGVRKLLLLLLIGISQTVLASSESNQLTFAPDGKKLSGLLDVPANGEAHALLIIVHGYGKTNVVEQNWYFDLRAHFAKRGIATFVWDKPGCGTSEGEFDPNRPFKSSAEHLYDQWLNGNRIVASGGSFDDYLAATADLRSDRFFGYLSGGDTSIGKAGFNALVENWRELG
jgi:hypothetical protein